MPLAIPDRMMAAIGDSPLRGPTLEFADRVSDILGDNETPFFPTYTDHGTHHVERVLEAIARLVPEKVWEQGVLEAADACVLVCSTLLHDLAMHMREPGFVELVSAGTRFEPREWFSLDQPGRTGDRPWPELWADFQAEARHFGTSDIELLLGQHGRSVPPLAFEEELDPDDWSIADRLLAGEFLRRHHGRIAHEISAFGFPGLDEDSFPTLTHTLPNLNNAIGAVARSHSESLRLMVQYLDYLEPGNKRPEGAFLHFHMGLLRIADFLQIEADRAPPLLLLLKRVQSPRSVEEWNKHGAISSVNWEHADPLAIYVTVSPKHGLRTHLALSDLFGEMQREMDTTVAVLRETYGHNSVQPRLNLSRQRLLSNLDGESLHEKLPYVPRRAALRSDPDLFRLVIDDLYGNQPAVAGRELIQNAVDAVRARRSWEARQGKSIPADELRKLEADVVVHLDEVGDGDFVLHIADRGIGMTPDVVIDYFQKAGASYGPTSRELEDLSPAELIGSMKAGRFGVGAFAAFLLGDEMRVTTRHVTAERGITFVARMSEDLAPLSWADGAPIGTAISIPFKAGDLPPRRYGNGELVSPDELLRTIASFYRLRSPSVAYRLSQAGHQREVLPSQDLPNPGGKLPDRWRSVRRSGMDSVLWRVPLRFSWDESEFEGQRGGMVAHNGILIQNLGRSYSFETDVYEWSDSSLRTLLRLPSLAVFDTRHKLGVALHRYGLVARALPFEAQLLESIGLDLVAHGAVVGSRNHPLQENLYLPAFSRTGWLPLTPPLLSDYADELLVLWRPNKFEGDDLQASIVDHLLSSRSSLRWSQFGHRTAIETDTSRDPTGPSQRYDRDPYLEVIPTEATKWAGALGGQVLSTVVIRGHPGAIATAPRHMSWAGASWSRYRGDAGDTDLLVLKGESPDPALDQKLLQAALDLHVENPASSLALTVIGEFAPPSDLFRQTALAWNRLVGGEMPRGTRQRPRIADELVEQHPSLRPLVDRWRRSKDEVDREL